MDEGGELRGRAEERAQAAQGCFLRVISLRGEKGFDRVKRAAHGAENARC